MKGPGEDWHMWYWHFRLVQYTIYLILMNLLTSLRVIVTHCRWHGRNKYQVASLVANNKAQDVLSNLVGVKIRGFKDRAGILYKGAAWTNNIMLFVKLYAFIQLFGMLMYCVLVCVHWCKCIGGPHVPVNGVIILWIHCHLYGADEYLIQYRCTLC